MNKHTICKAHTNITTQSQTFITVSAAAAAAAAETASSTAAVATAAVQNTPKHMRNTQRHTHIHSKHS